MTLVAEKMQPATRVSDTMRATVFHGPGDIRVEQVRRPHTRSATASSWARSRPAASAAPACLAT